MCACAVAESWATMFVKLKCYDRRTRMPLLFKVDRFSIVTSNAMSLTCLVAWANLTTTEFASATTRLEILLVIDMIVAMYIQKWLFTTIHSNDTKPYHEPGPLCAINRSRRLKIQYVIIGLSSGWCAAFSIAVITAAHDHDCTPLFMNAVIPALYSMYRTIVMDSPPTYDQPPVHTGSCTETEATNTFVIEEETHNSDDNQTDDEPESDGAAYL